MSMDPIDNLTQHIPPMASGGQYSCPVDGCDTVWSVPDTTVQWMDDALRVGGLTIASFEQVLEWHLAEHTAMDFLKTIRARDLRIVELALQEAESGER